MTERHCAGATTPVPPALVAVGDDVPLADLGAFRPLKGPELSKISTGAGRGVGG
ncbi:hypothetical protein NCC78_27840 [Micromonospora phytophila]|uniref:hypothetical protein n=1 Tax=Micromonospora phytophila TaxID=709888 RepID=UPI002030CB16|nr:hypothetical protein [Micromonospora phytophila]MCM0678458.1 hypothetical protein [Micromonospora phytophila]